MGQRLPARVYWVRRIVVLLALAVVVALVVVVVRLVGGSAPAARPAPSPSRTVPSSVSVPPTTPTARPSPTATHPGGVVDCAPGDLALTIVPTAPSFAAGVSPTFTLTITSSSAKACLVDAGETHRSIVITSGTDRIWSNQDCAPASSDPRTLLLAPKQADQTQLAWNLQRSAPGCPSGLPAPAAGTYVATFQVGGASAAPAAFTLG